MEYLEKTHMYMEKTCRHLTERLGGRPSCGKAMALIIASLYHPLEPDQENN